MREQVILIDLEVLRTVTHNILDHSCKYHCSIFTPLGINTPLKEHVVSGKGGLVTISHVKHNAPEAILEVKGAEVGVASEGIEDVEDTGHRVHIRNGDRVKEAQITCDTEESTNKVSVLGTTHRFLGVFTVLLHKGANSVDILN